MAGSRECPQCHAQIGFWNEFNSPLGLTCRHCKARLHYANARWLSGMWIALSIIPRAIGLVMLIRGSGGDVVPLFLLLLGGDPLIDLPFTWYARKRYFLEARA